MKRKRLNKIVDIGELDRKIQIKSISTAQDSYGAMVETVTSSDAWAKVNWLRDKEDESGGDLRGNYRIEVIIRYQSGITTLNKIVHDGRTFDIENYRELGRKRFIVLNCLSYG
jgi:SPP1 family predicted phage head-tail adaptor